MSESEEKSVLDKVRMSRFLKQQPITKAPAEIASLSVSPLSVETGSTTKYLASISLETIARGSSVDSNTCWEVFSPSCWISGADSLCPLDRMIPFLSSRLGALFFISLKKPSALEKLRGNSMVPKASLWALFI